MSKYLLFAFCVFSINAFASDLKPFTTDGCSVFPDGNLIDDAKWLQCCIEHDLAYWKGGTKTERQQADDDLQQCVENVGEKGISTVMHLGVTVGGTPVFPTWYRWGYGWPYARGYKSLTKTEKAQVRQRLSELRILIDEAVKQAR